MHLFGFKKKKKVQSYNSLDSLSENQKMFLVNYLGDRLISWQIDSPVKERYPNIEQNIADLCRLGLVQKGNGVYVLTSAGLDIRKNFRSQERSRHEDMLKSIMSFIKSGDYLSAYNARVKYERESIIPHGIHFPLSQKGDEACYTDTSLPLNVKNYIQDSYKLDFSDCRNSESFKAAMRALYVGTSIAGSERIILSEDFETDVGERLDCPSLEQQLQMKCTFLNPPKFRIYFSTKVKVFNLISTGVIDKWDGQFFLGVFDCTIPFHASMAQYENMKLACIDGLPKTFQTFYKHKEANDEKYMTWVDAYNKATTIE